MLWNMLASMVRLENIPCQKRVVRECHVKEGLQVLPLAFPTGLSVSAALLSSAHMALPVWKDLLLRFGVSPGFRGLSPERAPAPFTCDTQTACIPVVAKNGAAWSPRHVCTCLSCTTPERPRALHTENYVLLQCTIVMISSTVHGGLQNRL